MNVAGGIVLFFIFAFPYILAFIKRIYKKRLSIAFTKWSLLVNPTINIFRIGYYYFTWEASVINFHKSNINKLGLNASVMSHRVC